jgi:GT2 family glycosyltransferase
MLSTTAIIPVYKKLELFHDSFKNNRKHLENARVLIINDDPQSDLPNDAKLLDVSNTIFIRNSKNLGFAKTVNKAVASVETDLIMLLNSDVFLLDSSWQKAIECFQKNPKLFAISFAQDDGSGKITGRNRLYFKSGLFHHSSLQYEPNSELGTRNLELLSTAWAEGGSAIFRKSMWDKLGGFDENFSPFYWEDVDLSFRARECAWEVLFSPGIKVIHKHESTIRSFYDGAKVNEIAYSHQLYFTKKHTNLLQKIQLYSFLLKQKLIHFI